MFFVMRKPNKANDVHLNGAGNTAKEAFLDACARSFDEWFNGEIAEPFFFEPSTMIFADSKKAMEKSVTKGCDTCEELIRVLAP